MLDGVLRLILKAAFYTLFRSKWGCEVLDIPSHDIVFSLPACIDTAFSSRRTGDRRTYATPFRLKESIIEETFRCAGGSVMTMKSKKGICQKKEGPRSHREQM